MLYEKNKYSVSELTECFKDTDIPEIDNMQSVVLTDSTLTDINKMIDTLRLYHPTRAVYMCRLAEKINWINTKPDEHITSYRQIQVKIGALLALSSEYSYYKQYFSAYIISAATLSDFVLLPDVIHTYKDLGRFQLKVVQAFKDIQIDFNNPVPLARVGYFAVPATFFFKRWGTYIRYFNQRMGV